ncbi:hypothetical protein [Cellvibrio japonicus]|uniref:hypothetical protein n=1 Tax=Cellvibrio japonicus TaxID=155077 RepID=UPI0002EB4EE7|nr:hypothetical protein [Cellvibrio japonicus]QEI11863.1 hypothetical protein FY117_06220 [Cellvibrio japonicus]QEI15437.1 hypothetical protein FY116_06220 [Cellvibrio japonicus]QEI19016.1 hypothetical protein FY115_06220 [Cellvibrio japonicus]
MVDENRSYLESVVGFVGVVGGLIAIFTGVYQLWESNQQGVRNLRWEQAKMAREMVNNMLADEGWKAMEMMDWDDDGREYEINGEKVRINAGTIYAVLENPVSDARAKYIVDRFDRSLFLISQLEIAVRSSLVQIDDVRYPLSWYVGHRMCAKKALFEDYIKENAARETLQFFERLDEWNQCQR